MKETTNNGNNKPITNGNKNNLAFVAQHQDVVDAGQRLMQQRREEWQAKCNQSKMHILVR